MPADRRNAILPMLALSLASSLVPSLAARTGDGDLPITVDADNVEVNHTTGIGVYEGDVIIRQGTLEIHAQRAEFRVVDGSPETVIIQGAPATFQQEEDDGSLSEGRAARMEYLSDESRIRLTGGAWVRLAGSELAGDVVDYDLEAAVARVGSETGTTDAPPQRVRVVIEPRSDDGDAG